MTKKAIIIGAGPAGLTAAYELLERTDIKPIVLEATDDIGGISKTVEYKGNRIDIGGHRFFSKSERVMEWWNSILPIMGAPAKDDQILGRNVPVSEDPEAPDPDQENEVFLVRSRLSRIYYLRSFFDYPVSFSWQTFKNLGFIRTIKIGSSYLKSTIFKREEESLEDFFINRFGKELYKTFFKDYTEKVWGVSCQDIPADWGAQRIKGLSIFKAVLHAIKSILSKDDSISQSQTETSLIEQFMYPKFGPGQLWEKVAQIIEEKGGSVIKNARVIELNKENGKISRVKTDEKNNNTYSANYVFSSMPVVDLINSMNGSTPSNVTKVANGLMYRDFVTVGLLLDKLRIKNHTEMDTINNIVPDNWIYIQERDVKVGRLQIFNNWSPYMVKDNNKVWIGMEYFCNEGDELWNKNDDEFSDFATDELEKIDIINSEDVLDSIVIRMPKTYPAYFGTYNRFDEIRKFTDDIENLFLIGRNGMHRYNNADHSMLTAMKAVDNIIEGKTYKSNIWNVNTEEEYHEEK